jgi:hypothetical protein
MAEGMVVKEMLTNEMIKAGEQLIRLLDQAHLAVNAALWLYIPESNIWRFVVASPQAKTDGPKKIYQRIQSILSKRDRERPAIELRDISVVRNDDPLVALLRIAIRTNGDISGIRFSKNTINGRFIEDTFIYRMT